MSLHKLPDETLVKIFNNLSFATRRSILPLVCKDWRQLTKDQPALWESITLSTADEVSTLLILQNAQITEDLQYSMDKWFPRSAITRWFILNHRAVASVKVLHDYIAGEQGASIHFPELTRCLIGLKDTLTSLSLDRVSLFSEPLNLVWLANLRELNISLEMRSHASYGSLTLKEFSCLTNLEVCSFKQAEFQTCQTRFRD